MSINNNIKLVIVALAVGLPLMVSFQNCSKTQSFEQIGAMSAVPADDFGDLVPPPGLGNGAESVQTPPETVAIPQEGEPPQNNDNINEQPSQVVVQPIEATEDEIAQANQACEELEKMSESNNMDLAELVSEDNKSIYGIKGNHVISSKLFKGSSQIDLVDGVSGKLVICGMDVAKVSNTNGALILVNSRVGECINNKGNLQLIGNSSCDSAIDSSNVKVKVQSK